MPELPGSNVIIAGGADVTTINLARF